MTARKRHGALEDLSLRLAGKIPYYSKNEKVSTSLEARTLERAGPELQISRLKEFMSASQQRSGHVHRIATADTSDTYRTVSGLVSSDGFAIHKGSDSSLPHLKAFSVEAFLLT